MQSHALQCPPEKHALSNSHGDLFEAAYNDASFSDVVIKAGKLSLNAHKVVLAAHSATFKAMCQVSLC